MSLTLLTTAMSVCGVGELCPVSASFLKHSPDFFLGKFCALALTIGYPWSPWKPEGYSPHEISMKQTGPACLWMRNEVPVALKALVFQPHHDTHIRPAIANTKWRSRFTKSNIFSLYVFLLL